MALLVYILNMDQVGNNVALGVGNPRGPNSLQGGESSGPGGGE